MTAINDNYSAEAVSHSRQSKSIAVVGNVVLILSFVCTFSPFVALLLFALTGKDFVGFTGLGCMKLMGLAVALAIASGFLRSKFWWTALPPSIFMLFFLMYVMGS